MAKDAGSTRASKWEGDLYTVDGVRHEYGDLPRARQEVIQQTKKEVIKEMKANLKDKSVDLMADGERLHVTFPGSGIEHVANDAMLTLSGKYFSRSSMVHIDKILAQSTYVPTSHELYKTRDDGKTKFFRYQDSQGRGVYFGIAQDNNGPKGATRHFLYTVTDKVKK
ncbi:MAG: hypothetical protein NC421_07490 [Lachnospiraceae bacterium]|nr:hypothetical protein [Lachnospiraceae bacterium]